MKKVLFSHNEWDFYDDYSARHYHSVSNLSWWKWKITNGQLYWISPNNSYHFEGMLSTQQAYQKYLLQLITSGDVVHATTVHCK